MMPLIKNENEELIYEKASYSGMLNALNPNPIRGGVIERRQRIILKFPEKKSEKEIEAENLKKEKEMKETAKRNFRARFNPKALEIISLSSPAQAFLE